MKTNQKTIFITGSSDGLGLLAARELIAMGHRVVLHARNQQRAEETKNKVPGAEKVLVADLADREQTIRLAGDVNKLGVFDAVIHNAGVYQTAENTIFEVNTIAPYLLTCLIAKPSRLIYLSSGMHFYGDTNLQKLKTGRVSYSDSKFHDLLLAKVVARKWPDVSSNAVDPGWVPTKMGGAGATGDLRKGYETQVWLATSENATISGRYFYHQKEARYLKAADREDVQEQFLEICGEITGIVFPVS